MTVVPVPLVNAWPFLVTLQTTLSPVWPAAAVTLPAKEIGVPAVPVDGAAESETTGAAALLPATVNV